MGKEEIQIYQLEGSRFGIEIFGMKDVAEWVSLNRDILTPHRHDHYCCFFMESGQMNFKVDFQNIDMEGPSLLVTCPGQVHEPGLVKDIEGWMIAFDARFIDQNARMAIEQSFSKIILLRLGHAEKEWFTHICQLIRSTVRGEASAGFVQPLIQALVNAFFYKTVGIFQSQENERIQEYSLRSVEIVKKFNQMVQEQFIILKKPADYASAMNITVSHLNDTVKSVTGFSTTWFIQQEIFREAQRLLFYTDKSVKEIAFQLGYEDYKYFIRLFSKTTGTSPVTFRKKSK